MLKRFAYIGAVLLSVFFLLASCSKEEERIPVLTLPSTMVSSAGGEQTLSVAAESSWKLSVDYLEGGSGWITISAASGNGFESVTVTVAANETDSPR